MPVSKTAEKEMRVAERRHDQNKSVRTQVKSGITKAEKAIEDGQAEATKATVTAAASALDKAAKKGVIHPNKAARAKSRLTRRVNKAAAAPAAKKPETK